MVVTIRKWLGHSSLGIALSVFLVACGGGGPSSTPGFTISLDKTSISVEAGLSGTVVLTLAATDGFDNSVQVTASDLPEGVTVSDLTLAAGETSGTLTFEVATTTALGTYTPTLKASSGDFSKTATVTLTFN